MGEAFLVVGAKVGETVRFAGGLGEPGCGEDGGKKCFEGWHAAADYNKLFRPHGQLGASEGQGRNQCHLDAIDTLKIDIRVTLARINQN